MAAKKAPQTISPTAAAAAPALAPKPKKTAAPKNATAPKKATEVKAAPIKAASVAVKKAAPKKKTAAVVAAEPTLSAHQLQDEIRVEAYHYFIERNYLQGDPTADWHRAEDAVLRRYGLR